jgi:hypothetical protein
MSEILSMDEIKRRFDSEWVIVADPELDPGLNVLSGRVIVHGPDRDEVYARLLGMDPRPRHLASLYLGRFPDDMAIVL